MQILVVYGTTEGQAEKIASFVSERLSGRANAFLSVSLSAAGREPDDIGGLEKCVANFVQASGWRPQLVHHVAGAFRYSAYGLLTRYVMKYQAYRRGAPTDSHRDYELTDWDDVARFADTFAGARTVTRA